MARRRASGLGLIVVLVIIGGVYNLLAPHSSPTVPTNADITATPLFSRPAASAPAAAKPPGARSIILYGTATTLNVRATPTANGRVLLAAPRGTSVIAISQQDGWYEVKLTNGSTGWMSGAYLSEAGPQQQPTIVPPAPVAKQIDRDGAVSAIIAESLASYTGNCPCPYNTDRTGRSCGRRSAWSKAGGYAPLC